MKITRSFKPPKNGQIIGSVRRYRQRCQIGHCLTIHRDGSRTKSSPKPIGTSRIAALERKRLTTFLAEMPQIFASCHAFSDRCLVYQCPWVGRPRSRRRGPDRILDGVKCGASRSTGISHAPRRCVWTPSSSGREAITSRNSSAASFHYADLPESNPLEYRSAGYGAKLTLKRPTDSVCG
ncbi:hypothetical protein SAMN05414139_02298 [Burkholderia sp. D7]|nr:hypothetical protein SAMN05414139_02298 [Burkholderia sp. D7]